jgi:hypothetical protein
MSTGEQSGSDDLRRPLMQWMVTEHGFSDVHVHIQVGAVANEYYVEHTGFGDRRFPDRRAAWAAVKTLMRRHSGDWEEVPCDSAPLDCATRTGSEYSTTRSMTACPITGVT